MTMVTNRPAAAAGGGADFSGVTDGAMAKNTAGTPATAVNQIDYIGPQATASVTAATTITLPETGLLVPIIGSAGAQIDFITKPTGNAPRLALLWFAENFMRMRHQVAGAGAGAAHISMMIGSTVNDASLFQLNQLVWLMFDGTIWRRASDGSHWDGLAKKITGATNESAALVMNDAVGTRLEFGSAANSVLCDGTTVTTTAATAKFSARTLFTQGSVASASNVALPANCSSVLITGTTTVNTFTGTGWSEGMIVWLEFDGILTITHNSGGTNDFMGKTGANIATTAGMVLAFRFDGTDLREIGR